MAEEHPEKLHKVFINPAVGLQPFEVIKGVRHEDIKDAPWRYIQYEYTPRGMEIFEASLMETLRTITTKIA